MQMYCLTLPTCHFLILFSNIGFGSAKPSVLIVGAGSAGMSAAVKLLEKDITDILVLESSNRKGGRIYSVPFGDGMVDLGPRHCNGVKNSVCYDTAKDLNILKVSPFASDIFHPKKQRLNERDKRNVFEMLSNWLEITEKNKVGLANVTLGEFSNNRFFWVEQKRYQYDEWLLESAYFLLKRYMQRQGGQSNWFLPSAVTETDNGTPPPTYFDKNEVLEAQNLAWSGHGYITFLETLIAKLPQDKQAILHKRISLNSKVSSISWGGNGKVTVVTSQGSSHQADHVIFTPSLGVLKRHHKEIFKPQLPSYKRRAINVLLFGGEMKVVMLFSKKWWPDGYGFFLAWSNQARQNIRRECSQGLTKDGKIWVDNLFNLTPEINNTRVLVAWLAGEQIEEAQLFSDEKIANGITCAMKLFFRNYNVSKPIKLIRHSYTFDTNFYGCYGYQTVESRRGVSANLQLAESLYRGDKPVVLFAGDMTHPTRFQSVNGASETGFRAAQIIFEYSTRRDEIIGK